MPNKQVKLWLREVVGTEFELIQIAGRANSRIFKIKVGDVNYALKIYPDKTYDKRDRLGVEFDSLKKLHDSGIKNIPKVIQKDNKLNVALYEWIDGRNFSLIDTEEIHDSLSFIKTLSSLSKGQELFSNNQLASEACLSTEELKNQIYSRFVKLSKVKSERQLSSFLNDKFLPTFTEVVNKTTDLWDLNQQFNDDLSCGYRVLSPSDFGFHNAIKRNVDGRVIYIDFEYFGWDDPVKLTSDFIWHAGMELTEKASSYWLNGMKRIFSDDPEFERRLILLHPLYGLRWCMILLNEFLPHVWEIREHADHTYTKNRDEIKKLQLKKAENYLDKVREHL